MQKKLTSRQKQLKSEYMKLYRRLDKYGQAPMQPLSNPWQRDIERLKNRWSTVHEYAKIYNRFKRSVAGFNERYLQDVKMPVPHTAINTKTLETLKNVYDAWKGFRKKFVRKITSEHEEVLRNLKTLLSRALSFLSPNQFTGQYSYNDERISRNVYFLSDFIDRVIPTKQPERRIRLRQIKMVWEELVEAIQRFIYESEQQNRAEAWAKIVFLLTGSALEYNEIDDVAEEEYYYE